MVLQGTARWSRAESGDSKAEAMLLEFSFGDDLVRQSEIDVGALWSAAWEAAVEDHPLTLRERALAMRKAANSRVMIKVDSTT